MPRNHALFFAVPLLILASSPGAPAQTLPGLAYAPGELIVGFVDAASPAAEAAIHRRAAAVQVRALAPELGLRISLATFDPDADLDATQSVYRNDPAVAFVHPNYAGEGGFTPNDTGWMFLWHHRNTGFLGGTAGADLQSRGAWNISRGSDQIVVAVLDTGIDSDHQEFAGRIDAGYDFVNDDSDPEDDHGHGTMVTGLLAANADNAFSVAGVDHDCRIVPVKVLDQNNAGFTSNLISGLGFAASAGADVISMSLINYPGTAGLLSALTAAESAGSILVACAGNGGIGDADLSYPGAASNTISIGATDDNDERASFSGTGSALEFVAPGQSVYTAKYNDATDGATTFTGCSAATPVAAGVVSVMLSIDPALTTADVRSVLEQTAEDEVGDPVEDVPGWDPYMGFGRLNFLRALQNLVAVNAPEIAAASGDPFHVTVTPNPARNATSIRYTLPVNAWVTVTVVDVAGRRVRELFHGIGRSGANSLPWDGLDASGRPAAPGIYFAKVESSGRTEVDKVALLR